MNGYDYRTVVAVPAEYRAAINAVAFQIDPRNGPEMFGEPEYAAPGATTPTHCVRQSWSTGWAVDAIPAAIESGSLVGNLAAAPILAAAGVSVTEADNILQALQFYSWNKVTDEVVYPEQASSPGLEAALTHFGLQKVV